MLDPYFSLYRLYCLRDMALVAPDLNIPSYEDLAPWIPV